MKRAEVVASLYDTRERLRAALSGVEQLIRELEGGEPSARPVRPYDAPPEDPEVTAARFGVNLHDDQGEPPDWFPPYPTTVGDHERAADGRDAGRDADRDDPGGDVGDGGERG